MQTLNPGLRPTNDTWPFAQVPEPSAPFRRTEENELERLKNRLLRDAIARVATPALAGVARRAANEAAALAWLEADPLLVFPSLFQEKLALAKRRAHKQIQVQARSARLFAPER
jgi:hypothetical protein